MVNLQLEFSFFFNFSKSSTGRTGRPILTGNGSSDAVLPEKLPFGGHEDSQVH
jgi:hypothetical protein